MTSFFKNKKILITGGSGLIGQQLTKLLLKQKAKVTVASIDYFKNSRNLKFVRTDLRYLENCLKICKDQQIVFHLAGVKGSPKIIHDKPASIFVPTIMFSINMMEAARRMGVEKYLFTSSIGVYSPSKLFKEESVWKSFPSPNDKYAGWAKRICELQSEVYEIEYKWKNISIVRPANVYGPYDNFDPDNAMVIPSLIHKALNSRKKFNVWGSGAAIRDFIYSEDVAKGMMLVVKNNVKGPINLGSGKGISIKQIAEIISNNVPNGPLKINWDISKKTGDKIRLMDINKAKRIGFKPKVNIEEGIKKTLNWYLKFGKKFDMKRYNSFKEIN